MHSVYRTCFRRGLILQRKRLQIGKSYQGCVKNEQEALFNVKSIFKNVRKIEKLSEDRKRTNRIQFSV